MDPNNINDNANANDNVKEDVKDTKPDATSTEHINIKVVSADNSEVMFKIKRSTKLAKLMQAYCVRAGKSADTVRFLVDGERINGESTPDSLGLEDGDAIDAMTEQIGGSRCC
ncbi:SUMO protein smt3 [Coemansia sp. RSA 1813]|nr:SUMO protein smt3 [Coemansia sp. RSA 1646]KAJ1771356.1 SUMO protein smt3 [Coemansia sp. RSA 1843]KAJ2093129.1 SUMO protein smt3 [Coemansia sp. RSA 986]KAJ2217605.1 SUMO protein smt3 [Coemansia sp. RSA 487]KAJ2573382.1 SUMO protein smt3 [Coemansia sp. RSA 1813]